MWIVRHGESTWNVRDLVQGQSPGPVLTSRGWQQARAVAALLTGKPATAVVSSDLDRALQTAEPIARAVGLPVRTDARLRERALGEAEGRPSAQLAPGESGIANGRVVDPEAAPAGGESVSGLYRRVASYIAELADGTEPVLVTHGGVARVILAWTAGAGPEGMAWGPVANGGVLWRPTPPVAAREHRELEVQR